MRPRDAARHLRQTATDAEALLWDQLRDRRLDGYKFRRQYPLASFVADFCCPTFSLVVEVDGPIHRARHSADRARDQALQRIGFRVLRLTNRQVQQDLPAALQRIRDALASSPSDPPLSIATPSRRHSHTPPTRWRGGRGGEVRNSSSRWRPWSWRDPPSRDLPSPSGPPSPSSRWRAPGARPHVGTPEGSQGVTQAGRRCVRGAIMREPEPGVASPRGRWPPR